VLQVNFSPESESDIFNIWEFGASIFGDVQATRYVLDIKERVNWLAGNTEIWNRRSDVDASIYSYVQGSHQIFFEVEGDVLNVLRILHQRMDPGIHL
jgi:toxin ParE1/3/4